MDIREAAALLAYVAGFDNRQPSPAAAKAWADALAGIPLDPDVYQAVATFYARPADPGDTSTRWIQPHHIVSIRRNARHARIPDGAFLTPADDPPPGIGFTDHRRATVRAIADGRVPARPIAELTGGPAAAVEDHVRESWRVPLEVRAAASGVGDSFKAAHPELAVGCPVAGCRGDAGLRCTRPSGARLTLGSHRSRIEAHQDR